MPQLKEEFTLHTTSAKTTIIVMFAKMYWLFLVSNDPHTITIRRYPDQSVVIAQILSQKYARNKTNVEKTRDTRKNRNMEHKTWKQLFLKIAKEQKTKNQYQ